MLSKPIPTDTFQNKLIVGVFLLTVLFSLWGISIGWTNPNLYGNEFRQTQTAISAQFIQKEDNFSLAYPTPVLGKPWSIPYEFPLYQWTVVVTSNATGLSLAVAGRLVSTVCFYLGLPALYLLLRRVKVKPAHTLIVLSLVLCCPMYVFYARAFLIETMALMFGLWYLAALVKAVEQRHLGWLIMANVAGVGAGLVKVTTFMLFVLPAFALALGWIWQARPRREAPGWSATLRTVGWLAAVHLLPFVATLWWIHLSDAIKLLNPNGVALTSTHLSAYNFGTGRRFNPEIWALHWKIISEEIASPGTLFAGLGLALLFARRWWFWIFVCVGLYLLIQAIFPLLYAWHAYYHTGSAFLLVVALGFVLVGVFERARLPRLVPVGLWLAFIAVQISTYLMVYYPAQSARGDAGGLVEALSRIVRPEEDLIIAGDDWSSIIPYYSERRALMIRGDVSKNEAHLRKSFALMKSEAVGALVLMNNERNNELIRRLASEYFEIEPEASFRCHDRGFDATVYLNRQLRREATETLDKDKAYFHGVTFVEPAAPLPNPFAGAVFEYSYLFPRNRTLFRTIDPQPVRFFSTFGPELWDTDKPGSERYAAHPDTKLWFHLPAGSHRLRTSLELIAGAYQGVPYPDASDGVEIVAAAVDRDGHREILNRRYLNPRDNPADRGNQPIDWSFELPAGAEFELSVNAGPKGNAARDWSALSAISIQ